MKRFWNVICRCCEYLFVSYWRDRSRTNNRKMNLSEITAFFEHIRYQIVYFPADGSSLLPTGVGSGFMLNYKNRALFVTADHVVNTHDNGVRRIDKQATIQTNKIKCDGQGHYYSELVSIGGIVFCSHLKVDINTGDVRELPLFDGAFLVMNDFQKNAEYITSECYLNGAKVAQGEPKSRLDSSCICTANTNDEYFVYGRVRFRFFNSDKGQVYLHSQVISHDGLKYVRDDGDYYVLSYPHPVVVDDWRGLSGSPVLNHDGGLIGIACKVSEISNEVWVKKIQCMLPLFDAEILTSETDKKITTD